MATGGTIPSNRTQSVTFYNTTGVIEREKNVYYVPRFSKTGATAGQQVRTAWLNAFGSVCPPSSDYTAINISTWSPEDRTLRVKGNIDDFRLVTDEGECLNYFIITRSVSKTSGETVTTQTHYYGFFITGVRQSGGSTVEITCEPDDFTNVFYLHNKHTLIASDISGDYEPFNKNMKNCLIMRQHYNRIKNPIFHIQYTLRLSTIQNYGQVGDMIEIVDSHNVSKGFFTIVKIKATTSFVNLTIEDNNSTRSNLILDSGLYTINNIDDVSTFDNVLLSNWSKYTEGSYFTASVDNMKVFLNQNDAMPYRYQYRDTKYPISDSSSDNAVFTDTEMNTIANTNAFNSLSSTLREKIVRSCIAYLVVETKSMEKIGWYANEVVGGAQYIIKRNAGDLLTDNTSYNPPTPPSNSGVMPNVRIAFPTMIIPNEFKKYASSIESEFYYQYTYGNTIYWQPISKPINLMWSLSKSALSNFIYSMYYVKDVGISQSDIVVDLQYQHVNIKCNVEIFEPTGSVTSEGCVVGVMPIPLAKDENVTIGVAFEVAWRDHEILTPVFDTTNYWWGISIGNKVKTLPLLLKEKLNETIYYDSFFDPVLEAEPYSFYSISLYASYELVFNKNRYYSNVDLSGNYIVNINYLISINGAVKIGYIPIYTIENKETKYYNEGLVFTTSSSVPMTSNSYAEYYYQNKAQMKNQYAVADIQAFSGFASIGASSYGNIMGTALSKAGEMVSPTGAVNPAGIVDVATGVFGGLAKAGGNMGAHLVDSIANRVIVDKNIKAKLADMGAKPDPIKQAGSDFVYDMKSKEMGLYLNHYTIDELSYNTNARAFEKIGYYVNLYDSIHVVDRVGWNYVKLSLFDWNPDINIMASQDNTIRRIFAQGVMLLHDKTYLTSGHNFETILE